MATTTPSLADLHRIVPGFLRAPRISARVWVAVAVGIGAAVAAFAGLYPRFDNGTFRILIAAVSGPFGAAVVAFALSGKTWGRAFWRALLMSSVLGVAATVLPGVLLMSGHAEALPVVLVFGTVFGGPTGAIYGLPIAVLVAITHRSVAATSHASNDRASFWAGSWLLLASAFAAVMTWLLDVSKITDSGFYDVDYSAEIAPLVVALATALLALGGVARATMRMRRRSAWLARVQAGAESSFRVRPIDVRDDVDSLPRLGTSTKASDPSTSLAVLEWSGATERTTAYRMPPTGTPIALVTIEASSSSSSSSAPAPASASAASRSFAAS